MSQLERFRDLVSIGLVLRLVALFDRCVYIDTLVHVYTVNYNAEEVIDLELDYAIVLFAN